MTEYKFSAYKIGDRVIVKRDNEYKNGEITQIHYVLTEKESGCFYTVKVRSKQIGCDWEYINVEEIYRNVEQLKVFLKMEKEKEIEEALKNL